MRSLGYVPVYVTVLSFYLYFSLDVIYPFSWNIYDDGMITNINASVVS